MVLKGIDGLVELALAVLLFVFGPHGITEAAIWITTRFSSDTTRLWLSEHLVRHAHLAAGSVIFAASYLVVQGVVKLWLAEALLRERRKVFPIALGVMGLLIVAVIVREAEKPAIGLHILLLLNVVITFLIWREYTQLKQRRIT